MNEMLSRLFQPGVTLRSQVSFLHSTLSGHTFRADPNHLRELVNKISDLLIPEQTRCEGLVLLHNTLLQCPLLYADNKWSAVLVSVLQNRDSPICKEMACKCLIIIVENQRINAAHEQDAKNLLVPLIIKELLSRVADTDAWLCYAVRLTAVCMKCFPSSIPTQKLEELKYFILKLMDCLQVDVQDALGDCFAALPAVISKSASSDTYENTWLDQVVRTVKTLHDILNFFFTFCGKESSNFEMIAADILPLPLPSDETFVVIITKAGQFQTLCKCLVKMLSTPTECSVPVPINQLMQLLDRLFRIPEALYNIRGSHFRDVMTMLPAMQNAGITILEVLFLNFPSDMHSITLYISNLFEELLKASRANPVTRHEQSQLRSSTWRIIGIWVVQNGVNGVLQILQEDILEELRNEIAIRDLPAEAPETAKNEKVPLDMYAIKSPAGVWATSACCEALGVYRDIFYNGMPFIEESTVETIATNIISILCKIQNSKNFPFPYGSVNSRRQIYEVLLAIVTSQGPHRSFALRHSVGIFNRGLKDPSVQVVRICQQGIAHSKNILHPKKHTLPGIEQKSHQIEHERWQKNSWGAEYPWAANNQLHQDVPSISETVEISTTPYQENNDADLHISVAESYPSAAYGEHVTDSQVNGEDEIVGSKFRNWSQDVNESEEEIIEERKIYKDVSEKVPSEAKPVYSYSEPMPSVQEMEITPNSFNEQSVEEKMECDTHPIVEKRQPEKKNDDTCPNGDVVISDEEMPEVTIQKTDTGDCSVTSSEENSEEEEEVEEEEYEEAESIEDSPVKKLQISSEDLESDDGIPVPHSDSAAEEVEADQIEQESEPQADLPELVETEDQPPASPSLKEMCDTLVPVLCESNDGS